MTCVSDEKPKAVMRYSIIFSLVLSATAFFIKGEEACGIFIYLWMLLCVVSGLNALFFAIGAYRRKLFESGPLLASVVWLCLAGGYGLISGTGEQLPRITIFGHYPSDFVLLVWMIIVKYGLIARYVRIKNGMQELSGRILSAQEEERKRLSRDLHDSMGQNLAAVKFNLQRINKEMKNKLIDGVIDEISGSIKELRDIALGSCRCLCRQSG